VIAAACVAMAAFAGPAQAKPSWSGFGGARLGAALPRAAANACGVRVVTRRGVVADDLGGRAGLVNEIHTSARRVKGPFGLRVGMSGAALRRALGRHSKAFTFHGRRGRLLVGPKGRTLWAVGKSARVRTVGTFGVAISKTAALRAAKAAPCTPPMPTRTEPVPASSPAPDTGSAAPTPDPTPTDDGTPTTPTTPPQCPATLPSVGPYMRVACDESTGNRVQFTCHPDWRDVNQDPADGCESEKDGLQTMWFTQDSSFALASHILGIFQMDGYGTSYAADNPSYGWGTYDGFVDPVVVPVPPDCGSDPMVACSGGVPADPPPALDIDLTKQAGDNDRTYVGMSGGVASTGLQYYGDAQGTTQAIAGARFRLKTEAPIQVTHSGATCNITIDSTQGTVHDLQLDATLARVTDPDTGQGDDGPPQLSNVTISNLQSTDYSISPATPSDFVCFGAAFITAQQVVGAIQPALTEWFKAATRLCGAAGPYWWQPCPSSVDVGW
jgi:hypothetical protein